MNKVNEIRPDLVNMNSFDWTCSIHHADGIKELGLPLVLTIHLPEVTCARGTMMRWGNTPCDGEMIVKRCAACVCQQIWCKHSNIYFIGLYTIILSLILGIKLTIDSGTAISMKEVIRRRCKNVQPFVK